MEMQKTSMSSFIVVPMKWIFVKEMSRCCCLLLEFERSNHAIAHLKKSIYEEDFIEQMAEKINFSD